MTDGRGAPIEAIGKFTDIQSQKEMEARINIDAMTGCLRKDAFETLSMDYMNKNPQGKGVLLVVDLDNFKAVNDNLGHQFGDRVLRGVGDKLRGLFRGEDLVGRIGGDEFMVFMVGTDDLEVGKKKAKDILSILDANYSGAAHSYHVSASVGLACYPQDGTDFQTLYDHGDMALFDAKNRGKNGYVAYHNTLSKGTMENTLPFEVAARTLAQHYDSQVVEETFNLLFETKELDISLQTVLELIGKRFGVSRCYIFEQHPTQLNTYQNTYEWCNQGITAEKWRLQEVGLDIFQSFFDQANDDGVLYCNDVGLLQAKESREIMEIQSIKSFLHTYINSEEGVSYVLGVDECNNHRIWTPIEVSTILQATKIIAQFLSYKKALQNIESAAQIRLTAMDALDCYAYTIDRQSYQLTYFNEYLKKALPQLELGQTCYSVLRNQSVPCSDCPIKAMERSGTNAIRSVVAGTKLNRHLLTMSTLHPVFAGQESACITAIPLDDLREIQILGDSLLDSTADGQRI